MKKRLGSMAGKAKSLVDATGRGIVNMSSDMPLEVRKAELAVYLANQKAEDLAATRAKNKKAAANKGRGSEDRAKPPPKTKEPVLKKKGGFKAALKDSAADIAGAAREIVERKLYTRTLEMDTANDEESSGIR